MLMAVNEPYALMVQPDDILISPREVDEHFGTMVCFHPRYALGDHSIRSIFRKVCTLTHSPTFIPRKIF